MKNNSNIIYKIRASMEYPLTRLNNPPKKMFSFYCNYNTILYIFSSYYMLRDVNHVMPY